MKNKKTAYLILFMFYFSIGITTVFGQEAIVPNQPEEVRVLPNSYKEDYKGATYDYVESISYVDKFNAWLKDLISNLFSIRDENALNIIENLKILLYVLIIGGVVFLIVKMVLNKEGRWLFKRKKDAANELDYEIGENIQEVNFEALIDEALQAKDYRLAVRYNYLLVLKKLDQYNIISYDSQKTTYDYQIALEGTAYATGFNKATYYYTYIWYGEFAIDEKEYTTASTVYSQILKSFKNA
ncbi:hypothetical protein KO500_01650 [Cellulophaga baltica]|uniref:hypothetical protein n=1 Tax=Cellulophaga TaxID=104264 RepID=UPI001C07EB92|nr:MULTISPECIES: hypothetical protein [Cellulophaga]MBU2995114.1 hypothetical protein [Cellulophaga baltica]MDO6766509.1 hypothetical protein [Cellulophaga sp. 1_MG-2023]